MPIQTAIRNSIYVLSCFCIPTLSNFSQAAETRPNILFIAVDDLNDWIGCLGGHPQAKTPHIDRLAASGVLFTNAHCPAPACNPSRTAIFTGRSPHKSGLYANGQNMRDVLPNAVLMPKHFSQHGYWSAGSGKLLHYFIDAPSWDAYFPDKQTENPFPRTFYPAKRPVSLPRGGPWQYVETDWAALDVSNEEYGGDWLVSEWIGKQLARRHDQPFFLACGIYRPHEPWFVPREYFQDFPLESIQLPPGYREDDLDDLPPAGRRMGPNRYFAHIRKHNQWRPAIQAYLASIQFADAMVGRVLDALEQGPNRDNTIVVLWSDHGWHLGEKQHWQKYTAWRACTRVPLIIRVPSGAPGLPLGTKAAAKVTRPVNLLSLFPTLLQLSGLPADEQHDGRSLVPLLREPQLAWPYPSITYLAEPGSFSASGHRWRYIRYANGDEELYDIESDPYEWSNLAAQDEFRAKLEEFRGLSPQTFAPKPEVRDQDLPTLTWHPVQDGQLPASQPDGNPFRIVFRNQSGETVKVQWVSPEGRLKFYSQLAPNQRFQQRARPGAVWAVTTAMDKPLGYFVIGDRPARGDIPK